MVSDPFFLFVLIFVSLYSRSPRCLPCPRFPAHARAHTPGPASTCPHAPTCCKELPFPLPPQSSTLAVFLCSPVLKRFLFLSFLLAPCLGSLVWSCRLNLRARSRPRCSHVKCEPSSRFVHVAMPIQKGFQLSLQDSPPPSASLSPSPPRFPRTLAGHRSSLVPHIAGIAPAASKPLTQRGSGSVQTALLDLVGLASPPDNAIGGLRMNSVLVSHSPVRPVSFPFI